MALSATSGFYCDVIAVVAVFFCMLTACFLASSRLFAVTTSLFFFFWGVLVLQSLLSPDISPQSIKNNYSVTPLTIEGVVASRPSVGPEGSRLNVQVEHLIYAERVEAVSGLLLLNVREGDVSLARGDRIRFTSTIAMPRRLGLPGEFDYPRYLALQGISATSRVTSQNEILLIRAASTDSLQRSIDQTARHLGDSIRDSFADERISSVLTALLLGDQRRIPRNLAEAYTRAGVNHILSISGFHVGIIAAFITVLVLWLMTRLEYTALRWNIRMIALLTAVPVMLAYLFLTGMAPATARSVVMLSVIALGLLAEREHDSINTLLFAAFLLVAINPPTLFDVSFQLSFISLWGILIAVPLIMRHTATVGQRWLRGMIQFVAVSVAASCVTILPVLFIFNVASLNGILTNFLIVPLLGYGAVLAGFIALPLVTMFPAFAHIFLWPAATLVALSNTFIMWCTSLPVFTFHGITGLDMFFFLLFMTCMTFIKDRSLLRGTLVLVPVCAVIMHLYTANATDGRLHITMLSVGQGESLLVRLPGGSTMLVDGGGYLYDTDHDFGQRVLGPALGALHAGHIDRMVATHDHPDHCGGLPYIIKNFSVNEFLSGMGVSPEVRRALDINGVKRRVLAAGDVVTLPGPVVLTVLSPAESGQVKDELRANEQSLVFRLSYGNFSMIFCADAGFEAEERMLDSGHKLQSTVIKVGHHGSRYSTSERFLERVRPEIALISAGAGNRFGLPAGRTVRLLKSKGISVLRTDQDGTVELVTDGVTWSVATPYKPE
ncbi:MAG: DNA internalization-related competence protein ComEC/Rec2 [Desulfuromonadaceae bacterium]|nr:DNA internalization-related competence protein ComEC/Rec2 [Desulfuromonadaceae bacterium]MDD2846931.1 DNA internalization-related competence protein ComEC/Rec2 [Desulfuromonadaceae bacterium]MDD4129091.1 DNA internalization-related competence protein ComEC/Rec2 [Desulfuromonadaceae bacterium]